jgi:hypothetical protein
MCALSVESGYKTVSFGRRASKTHVEATMNEEYTMFLYARPSVIEGAARVVDIGGTLNQYNASLTPEQADRLAFAADLAAVRQDIAVAQRNLRLELTGGEAG